MKQGAVPFWPGPTRVGGSGARCRPGMMIRSWALRPCQIAAFWLQRQDPFLAVLEADGSVRWAHSSPNADFRDQDKTLAMSAEGAIVDFGFETAGQSPLRFDLRARKLSRDPPADEQTIRPKQTGLLSNVGKTSATRPLMASQLRSNPREVTELGRPSGRKPLRAWNRVVSASL